MQITLDVSTLTAAQRLHVAQFITDYPYAEDEQDNASDDAVMGFEITSVDEDVEEDIPSPVASFGPALVPPPPPLTYSEAVAFEDSIAVIPLPPPPVTPIAIDKAGLPWDERIHASSKAFVADGTWRKKRNVDEGIIAQVEAELRVVMGIAAPVGPVPPVPPVNPTLAAVIPPPPPVPVAVTTVLPPPIPIASTAAPTTPAAPAAGEVNPYLSLVQLATNVLTTKKLSRVELDAVIASVDPSLNLQNLSKRPDLCPQISASIKALVAA